ncbi:MAG TPA: histidine kinase [Ornithinibacter sp.]|nr:histidine kinase [Ornithinibacter sp.]
MPVSRVPLHRRAADFFGVDDAWQRPRPEVSRGDVALAVAAAVLGLVSLELVRSVGVLEQVSAPWWVQALATTSGAALLVGRRRWPLTVATLAALHMFVVGVTMPPVMGQFTLQVIYFVAIFAAVAWSRDRRLMVLVVGAIVLGMFLWIAWQFLLGTGVQDFLDERDGTARTGLVGPVPAAVVLTLLINVIYFGGAVIGGQLAWRAARQRAQLEAQADTIRDQSDSLRRRAVTDERLRIARELHDVVGHHVSVIGIQAAAARRVLDHDPAAAATALAAIEQSSRDGVTQMRSLLGTLRDLDDDLDDRGGTPEARMPEPGVRDLPALVAARESSGLATAYDVVESSPGAVERLPAPLGLALYRVVQEALANTSRHSTARRASVVIRVDEDGARPHAEVEVLDDGRPRGRTSGSGLGHLGVRERAASQRGEAEIGPRPTGGYRVRVRIPLRENDV